MDRLNESCEIRGKMDKGQLNICGKMDMGPDGLFLLPQLQTFLH